MSNDPRPDPSAPIPPPDEMPVNYAPPGYAPDYGYHYPPPPPPDYVAPPAPPRKSNAPLIAVVVAVALLLCGGAVTAGILVVHNVTDRAREAVKPLTEPTVPNLGGLPTDLPTDTGSHQIQVTYEVTGDGPVQIIYLNKLGAPPTRVADAKLPWRFSGTMETPALVSVIAMRSDTSEGTITCRTLVDGKEVKKATSDDNALATAACSYFALD